MGAEPAVLDALRDGRERGVGLRYATGLPAGRLYPALARLARAGYVRHEDLGYSLTEAGRARAAAGPRAVGAWLWWLPAAMIGLVTAYAALHRPAAARLTDLGVYLGAVNGLRHGDSLYDFISAGHAPFTYPPFAALLFWPLTFVGSGALPVLWTGATLAAVAWIARTTAGRPAGIFATERPAAIFAAERSAGIFAAGLMLAAPVASDLKYGQVSVALAALVLVDVLVLGDRRAHGVLIGIAAAIKLTPLIFLPMLWVAGRRRAALVGAAAFGAAVALAGLVLPGDSARFWGREMWNVSRLGYVTSVGNQSFDGALMRFGMGDPERSLLLLAVAAVVGVAALRRAGSLARNGDMLAAVVVTGAASIVLSPVSWTHHQTWLVLAALLPVGSTATRRRLWIGFVLAVMILPVTALGPPILSNARLLLAMAVAGAVPIGGRACLGGAGAGKPQEPPSSLAGVAHVHHHRAADLDP